jgi:hypothetical protein
MRTIEKDVGGIKVVEVIMEESDFSSAELIANRLAICNTCEFVSANKDSCSKCSCLLESRTKYIEMFCPVGRW